MTGGQAGFGASAGLPPQPEPVPSGAQMSTTDARTAGTPAVTWAQAGELRGGIEGNEDALRRRAERGGRPATSATSAGQKAGSVW